MTTDDRRGSTGSTGPIDTRIRATVVARADGLGQSTAAGEAVEGGTA
ncbi:hypothetical protein [Halorubrum kocurii]|nr:hypothetical protein [Halorubrum kocurii]